MINKQPRKFARLFYFWKVKYKPIVLFVLKFVLVYAVGVWVYNTYLGQYTELIDPLSWEVTEQVTFLMQLFFDDISSSDYPGYLVADIYCADDNIIRIVEGCNGVSVMILFAAFIIAFQGPWKYTLLFIPSGILFIHLANIFRIFVLGVVALKQPDWSAFFHQYFFPAAIYGAVFLLWVVWVRLVFKWNTEPSTV